MKQRRLAEGGRLREADIARDDGAKHLVAEVRDELRAHLVGEVVAGVEHGAQHALDRELRIGGHADLFHGGEQRRQPLERVILALHGNEHAVGRDQRVDGEHVERRRTVDEDDVEGFALGLERLAQLDLPSDRQRQQAHFRGGEVLVGRQQHEVALFDLDQCGRKIAFPEQHFTGAALERALVDPAAHGGVALRIQIHQQHAPPRGGEGCREIDRRGGLADAALLVRDGDDPLHGRQCTSPPRPRRKRGLRRGLLPGVLRPPVGADAGPGARAPSGPPPRSSRDSRAGRARRSPSAARESPGYRQ